MPKSTTSTPSGSSRPASRLTTSTPKPSSPRNMLPTPATRMRLLMSGLGLWVQRYNLLGGEEEPVPRHAIPPQVPSRVVLQRHRDIDLVLIILLYVLDERSLSGEREVHDVLPGVGPEQDPAPLLELDTLHDHALKRGFFLVLPEEVLHVSTPSASVTPGSPHANS